MNAEQQLRMEDLPAWMRPRERVINWGLIVALAFSVIVVVPLLTRPGLIPRTEAELYEYRSLEVMRLVQSGVLYSRWAPDLNYEFGSPLFNYLAPLPHYLTGYYEALTEATPSNSIKLALALSILAAAAGMYLFVRKRWGAMSGIISALTYTFSTPIALHLPYITGDLSLLMAMALLPWALWGLDRLGSDPRRCWIAAMLLALVILSDARIAFLSIAVVGLALLTHPRASARTYRQALLAIVAALAISSFFWLPALAERDSIHWQPTSADPGSGPLSFADILSTTSPPLNPGLGAGTWLVALIGAGALVVRRDQPRYPLAFLAAGVIYLVAALPAFTWLWPSPQTFQAVLPYYAVLMAVCCFAVVAGQSVQLLEMVNTRWRASGLAFLAILAPMLALSALHPPDWSPTNEPTWLSMTQAELQGSHKGAFHDGVLLPAAAPTLPAPPDDLLNRTDENAFQRLNFKAYSANTQLDILEQGPLFNHYNISSAQSLNLDFSVLAFPGWNVSIGGVRQPLRITSQGLIAVSMPPLAGDVALWLEGTPVRYLAWAISWLGVILLFFAGRRRTWSNTASLPDEQPRITPTRTYPLLSAQEVITLAVVLVVYAALVMLVNLLPTLLSPL